jgi:hypothetical protein
MTGRRVAGLLIAGVVVVAVALFMSSRRDGSSETQSGEAVLPELKASVNEVTEIRLTRSGTGGTVLKKQSDTWVVGGRDYPADAGQVRKLLLDLADMRVVEEKTSDPENYSKLGVEDVSASGSTGTRIEVVNPKKTHTLILGKTTGGKSMYVRLADAKQSYQATPQISVDADAARWMDRTVIDIPQDRVKEVALTPASGPSYTVSREKKEDAEFAVSNVPKGRELSSSTIASSVAGALVALNLDDVRKAGAPSEISPAEGAESGNGKASRDAAKPSTAHAVFKTFDGLTLDITGRQEGDERLLSIKAESTAKETASEASVLNKRFAGWEFEVPTYKYDAIFKPMEELLTEKEKK